MVIYVRENGEMKVPRRKLASVLAGVAIAATTVLAVATPAQAASCYNRGSLSFQFTTSSSGNPVYDIRAWNGTGCSGTPAIVGSARKYSSGKLLISTLDNICDNYGGTLYTHARSVASNGCQGSPSVVFNKSELAGQNYNMWLHFRGVNSDAHPLPPV